MNRPPRVLFLPVSAARGTGEYARSLAIAQAVKVRWPDAEIRFMVSAEASYARSVPFETKILPRSPTMQPTEVANYIADVRPDVVVLDNAGRSSILRAARAAGARLVFVSSRARQRAKAFRWRWMRMLDEHWIAYPELLAGSLSWLERFKLTLLRRPCVRFLDTLLPAQPSDVAGPLQRYGLSANDYVLVVPGGGSSHRSMPFAPEAIARGALLIAGRGQRTLLLGVSPDGYADERPSTLTFEKSVAMPDLITLIANAKLVVSNGADTLLQVIALGRPCIAVPMSPDQNQRLAALKTAGLDVSVDARASVIDAEVERLLRDPAALAERQAVMQRVALRDGLPIAIDSIGKLLAADS